MSCLRISKEREVVIEYCAGSLEPERVAEFEHHLTECAECARLVVAQREVWGSLDRLAHEDAPEVTPDFDARLYARIAQEEAAPTWRRWLRRILQPAAPVAAWKPALSMAALFAIGLSVYWVQQPVAQQGQTYILMVQPASHNANVDIEQVANTLDELDILMPTPASKSVM